MKNYKWSVFIFLCFFQALLHGQNFTTTLHLGSQKGLTRIGASTDNFVRIYSISATTVEDGFVNITIRSDNSKSESFKIKPFTYELFKSKFSLSLARLIKEVENKDLSPVSLIEENGEVYISSLFGQIVSSFNTDNDRPIVAVVSLKKKIRIRSFKECESFPIENNDYRIATLNNVKAEIAFFEGFIEKIEITGYVNDVKMVFTNRYSIGISSINDVRKLRNSRLQSINTYVHNATQSKIEEYIGNEGCYLYLLLGDILDYDRVIDVNANDISPVSQRVVLDNEQQSISLYREESSKLLEATIFSDFFGVFNENSPNGILQTELTKRFNLKTSKRDIDNHFSQILFFPLFIADGYGTFEYFDLDFRISKLEQSNRYLLPERRVISPESGDSIASVSLIGLHQHQNFLFGGKFNILSMENQNFKFKSNLEAGFSYGRSGVRLNNEDLNLNSLQFPIILTIQFLPEKRFYFNIDNEIRYFRLLTSNDLSIQTLNDGIYELSSEWIISSSLKGSLNISDNGRIFARYNFIHQLGNMEDNYSMFQIGYSFYILDQGD